MTPGGANRCVVGLARSLLLATTALWLAPACAQASFPGANGVIAYVSDGDGIWAAQPGSGDQLQLTTGAEDRWPSFSPTGSLLAFQRGAGTGATVWLAQADGSEPRPLVSGSEPAFYPDSSAIIFVRPSGLFATGLTAGSPVRQLTAHAGDSEPASSATGALAFERAHVTHVRHGRAARRRVRTELDVIMHPGANPRTLLTLAFESGGRSESESELHPDWSPSGRRLEVSVCGEPPRHLPSGISPALVLHGSCAPAVWAPDGRGTIGPEQVPLGGRKIQCPEFVSSGAEIAWQPLVSGTEPVVTRKCEPRPGPVFPIAESPGPPSGSKICVTYRHRRRCYKA